MTQSFPQNIIAVVWDFDKTLIPGHMQAPLFDAYQIKENDFWGEVNRLPEEYKRQGCDQVCNEALYLNHILDYVRRGIFKDLNNKKLREFGAELVFYEGLPEFFDQLKQSLELPRYQAHDIKLEHYVVSTGLRQIILGSKLHDHIDGVWACDLLDEKDGDGQARLASIAYLLDHTTKTRAVFEINKGVNVSPKIDVNARLEDNERRVPISQMICVADGPSDVPMFSVVNRFKGHTFAVHNPKSKQAYNQAYDLQHKEKRVDAMGPADYREDTETWRWLMRTVKDLAEEIVERRVRQLESSVGTAPGHLSE